MPRKLSEIEDFNEYMTYVYDHVKQNADCTKCSECGGLGIVPIRCCSGHDCGCMGLPIEFELDCKVCGLKAAEEI